MAYFWKHESITESSKKDLISSQMEAASLSGTLENMSFVNVQ